MNQQTAAANLQMQLTCIHIDFEQAVVETVRSEFGIEPTGSLFHFSQSKFHHVQHNCLQTAYYDYNPLAVRTWVRRLIDLL